MGTYFKVSTAFIFSKSSVFPVLLYFYMAESNAFTRKQVLAIVKVMGNRNSENFQAEKQVWGFFFSLLEGVFSKRTLPLVTQD